MKKSIIAILLSISLTCVFAQNDNNIRIYPDVVYHHKDGMVLTGTATELHRLRLQDHNITQ